MISVDDVILSIARTIDAAGGRALLVGGVVRDALLGFTSKDYDLEIYGLTLDQLETLLARYGHVIAVGRSFGVLRVKGIDADFSLPRRESKTGRGHRGFLVECDPTLTFEAAARRRDVTINSIGYDVLTEELLDPHGGQRDLTEGVLRATDPAHFGEDPLRALRVAQLTARFEFSVDPSLETLCSEQDLSELAHERIFEELRKLLVKGKRPSLGLEFLRRTTLLRFFPELEMLVETPLKTSPETSASKWHETLMSVDCIALHRRNDGSETFTLALAALCHRFDKPPATTMTERFLTRLHAPHDLARHVVSLVRHRHEPLLLLRSHAEPVAYRRFARTLADEGVTLDEFARFVRCDSHLQNTVDEFIANARRYVTEENTFRDAVMGRHLIAKGMVPNPKFAEILSRCRDIQFETGITDADAILERYFAESEASDAAARNDPN